MFVCCVCLCCQVEVSATRWSLVQRSATKCGESLGVLIKKSREREVHSPRWVADPQKKVLLCVIYQLNFTVFMYVTRISRHWKRSVLSVVSRNCSRSWNILPVDTGALL
jgi:hypothetical protein